MSSLQIRYAAIAVASTVLGYTAFTVIEGPRKSSAASQLTVAQNGAQSAAADRPTEIKDMPSLPKGTQWDFIAGVRVAPLQGLQLVNGQVPLGMVAAPVDGHHAIGLRVSSFTKEAMYRATVWIKSGDGTKSVLIQVRDGKDPDTGVAHEGAARFDLISSAPLTAQGNIFAKGSEPAADGWQKFWVDLGSSDGQVFVTVNLIEEGTDSDTFRGAGQQLFFGGIEVDERH